MTSRPNARNPAPAPSSSVKLRSSGLTQVFLDHDAAAVLSALNLGEGATIAAVTSMLIALNAPAAIAAAAGALIVKVFIWPARDELCAIWQERIEAN